MGRPLKQESERTAYCLPRNRVRQSWGPWDAKDEARFWSYVRKAGPDECWEWIGHKRGGYGNIWMKGVMVNAHRCAWKFAGNELPEWPRVIDHICQNKGCVNPKHLREIHQYDNSVTFAPGPWGENKRKTECKYGHPFTPENTHWFYASGWSRYPSRLCLTCYRARQPGKSRKHSNTRETAYRPIPRNR